MIGAGYDAVVTWIRSSIVAAFLILFVVTLFYHALLGVQVVIEDYVHNEGLKAAVLVGIRFIMSALVLVASIAILRIDGGGDVLGAGLSHRRTPVRYRGGRRRRRPACAPPSAWR